MPYPKKYTKKELKAHGASIKKIMKAPGKKKPKKKSPKKKMGY